MELGLSLTTWMIQIPRAAAGFHLAMFLREKRCYNEWDILNMLQRRSWSPWTAPHPAPSSSAWSGWWWRCVAPASLRRRSCLLMVEDLVNIKAVVHEEKIRGSGKDLINHLDRRKWSWLSLILRMQIFRLTDYCYLFLYILCVENTFFEKFA